MTLAALDPTHKRLLIFGKGSAGKTTASSVTAVQVAAVRTGGDPGPGPGGRRGDA